MGRILRFSFAFVSLVPKHRLIPKTFYNAQSIQLINPKPTSYVQSIIETHEIKLTCVGAKRIFKYHKMMTFLYDNIYFMPYLL